MVVLNQQNSENPRMYDLSFMYTLRCDLKCPFCMYDSGPDVWDSMNMPMLDNWLWTVDPNLIASFGLYGGEPGVDLEGFGYCLQMAKRIIGERPSFVITNGTWSTSMEKTDVFLRWCSDNGLFVVVSGTPFHRKTQDREILETLVQLYPTAMRLKPEHENFIPMGRLGHNEVACTVKCRSWNRASRIAVKPNGDILFQNCDGVFPVVGTYHDRFDVIDEKVQRWRAEGAKECPYYKEL